MLQGVVDNQAIIHKSLLKVKQNIHATDISVNQKASENQVKTK